MLAAVLRALTDIHEAIRTMGSSERNKVMITNA